MMDSMVESYGCKQSSRTESKDLCGACFVDHDVVSVTKAASGTAVEAWTDGFGCTAAKNSMGTAEMQVTIRLPGGRRTAALFAQPWTRVDELLRETMDALGDDVASYGRLRLRLRYGSRMLGGETLGQLGVDSWVVFDCYEQVDGGATAAPAAGDSQSSVPLSLSSEEEDDRQVILSLFKQIDSDQNNKISTEEFRTAMDKYQQPEQKELVDALRKMMAKSMQGEVSFEDFYAVVKGLPRARGQRVQWVRTLGLDARLAMLLEMGDIFDGLSALKRMSPENLRDHVKHVCAEFSAKLPQLLEEKLEALRKDEVLSVEQFKNTKFDMAGSFEGNFAKLEDFYDGPEKKIGTPNPKVEEGMRREHCERQNAKTVYTSPNYNFDFMPETEYLFVTKADKSVKYPHTPKERTSWSILEQDTWKGNHGREVVDLQEFMEKPLVSAVKLKQGEVIALRLYTGPTFMLYNAVLREFPKEVFENLQGNKYETTIFCIISGVAKLSKATEIPHDRRVYRGLGGMILPDAFWRTNIGREEEGGLRGGIEWGLMSTTTNRDVAIQYSGKDKRRGTVFEISVGRIDIGADLAWVSQYPAEKEILFPPLTCLEVVGEPRVEGDVIVFPLRANMNLKGLTLEQLEERRKFLHLAMLKNLGEELVIQGSEALSKWKPEQDQSKTASGEKIQKRVMEEFQSLVEEHERVAHEDFNADPLFKQYITEAIDGKSLALLKMNIYLDSVELNRKAEALERIFDFNFLDLKSKAAELKLRTGVDDFPWGEVVEQRSAKVNLGEWNAAALDSEARASVVRALGENNNIVSVILKGVELSLENGWNTTALNFSNNLAVRELPATVSLLLTNCRNLTALDLRSNNMGPGGGAVVAAALTSLSSLQSLNLRGNGFGAGGWNTVMDAVDRCKSLSSLNCLDSFNAVQQGGLRELDVDNKELAVALARYLPRSASTLTKLDARCNSMGPRGMTALAEVLTSLTELQSLNLRWNELGSDGCAKLCEALAGLTKLESLDLRQESPSAPGPPTYEFPAFVGSLAHPRSRTATPLVANLVRHASSSSPSHTHREANRHPVTPHLLFPHPPTSPHPPGEEAPGDPPTENCRSPLTAPAGVGTGRSNGIDDDAERLAQQSLNHISTLKINF